MSDPCSMCIYEHTGTTGTTGYSVPQTYPGDPSPERTIRLRVESAESGVICRVVYSCTRHLALVLASRLLLLLERRALTAFDEGQCNIRCTHV